MAGFNFAVENEYKERLQLTDNPEYDILSITGLTPASANINISAAGISDGGKFNSSRVDPRNIVITLKYKRNVEANRIHLYKFFRPKKYVKLYYKNKHRDVCIEGYIETFEGNLFEKGQKAQISILCPQPYFKDNVTTITSFSTVSSALEFPVEFTEEGIEFSQISSYVEKLIPNDGDVETGMILELIANDNVVEPTLYNILTNEQFKIEVEMVKGDVIIINTIQGEKSISLVRDGVTTNIINNVYRGSTWFSLKEGDNILVYDCVFGTENLYINCHVTPLYGGV